MSSEELKDLLDKIQEEWHSALYADLENGVAWLNGKAAKEFNSRYPNISKFGEFLYNIDLGGVDK